MKVLVISDDRNYLRVVKVSKVEQIVSDLLDYSDVVSTSAGDKGVKVNVRFLKRHTWLDLTTREGKIVFKLRIEKVI